MSHSHHHSEHSHTVPDDKKAVCPISGDAVDMDVAEKAGHTREYNGKKIYFCCAGCAQEFDEQSEEHIAHQNR